MATPKSIGRYEIISEIGHGAMGVVYLAHDPRIDRRVAIKTIHALEVLPDGEAEEVRQRFTREAQAAGRLQHPGIVTIFDVGEQGGTYFIAMEYIEGFTLEAYARKENLLPATRTLDLIVQACDALDYAHQMHIIHRDIKPANMMLLKNGRLKITDFGLAKNPHTSLTQEGILIGTPNYMSPEQVMGRPLDGRTDLFSLAAVLYELLTGERPFPGETVTTIIYRILNEHPAPPQGINRGIPPAVGQVLMKALAKEPENRYQTGAQLAEALQGRAVMVAAAGVGATRTLSVPARSAPPQSAAASPAVSRPQAAQSPRPAVAASPRVSPWPGRAKVAFISLATLGLVLLLPAAGNKTDQWGLGGADGGKQAGQGSAPAAASIAPPVTLPGAAATRSITWVTAPPGGRIYIDDVEAPGGVIRLAESDTAAHTVVAENDCFIEKVAYRGGADADGATRTIKLATPKVIQVPVESRPSGARILVDGRDTSQVTPAAVAVSACQPHALTLRLEGHLEAQASIGKTTDPVSLELARQPMGTLKLASPYPVTILENGRTLGKSGDAIRLTGGQHKLVLKNDDLFVETRLTVTIPADKTVSPAAGLPGTGTLTVLASPSNCTIAINGRDLGAPPINDYQLAAGKYTLTAIYVPTGESKQASVTITAGAASRVPFKFNQ